MARQLLLSVLSNVLSVRCYRFVLDNKHSQLFLFANPIYPCFLNSQALENGNEKTFLQLSSLSKLLKKKNNKLEKNRILSGNLKKIFARKQVEILNTHFNELS